MNAAYAWLALPREERPHSAALARQFGDAFARLLAPMAPHAAEELWEKLGHSKSVFLSGWPEVDAAGLRRESFELVVQINGKVRARLAARAEASEGEVRALAMADERTRPWLAGKTIRKAVYVPGKLLNIVAT